MKTIALAAAFVLAFALPAVAQSATKTTYTPTDATTLQTCMEAVRDSASDTKQLPQDHCIGVANTLCQVGPDGLTTLGLATCSMREAAWWDEQLNTNYGELKTVLEPEAFDDLKLSQRAWLKFRDAECAFQYARWGDGTMRSIASATCQMQQTATRAIALGALLAEGF